MQLVAAYDNNGAVSYPAFFECVWGVVAHDGCCNAEEIGYCVNSEINLCAYGKTQRVFWSDGRYTISGGNSYACAHVTGIMAKALLGNPNVDIGNYLRKKAKFILEFGDYGAKNIVPDIRQYRRAAIYPFNKEMHSLIRFEEQLSFHIAGVYDTKYSARINSSTNTILNIKGTKNHVIENIESLDWENIDTLILGHTKEMTDVLGEKIPRTHELIHQALQRGINVYSFDDYYDMFGENPRYFSPSLRSLEEFRLLPFGKLYKFTKPVVGVFGTNSKQGKFTLQLYLRYILKERGYSLSQLGSEPTAYLYGMDACCHFGYGTRINSSYALFAAYINNIMGYLDQSESDLILVGCQSNTVPYELGNVNDFTFLQTAFLWGTSPDIVVLCINPYDEISYILQTVKYIEAAVECKVAAVAVFPSDVQNIYAGIYGTQITLDEERFLQLKERIKAEAEIPVYWLGDMEQMNEMTDIILEYLS